MPSRLTLRAASLRANQPPKCSTSSRANAELIASCQALNAKKAGDRAPGFTLNDPDGHAVSSVELLANGPLVVSFYGGVWCPYCNLELQALQAASPQVARSAAPTLFTSNMLRRNGSTMR